MKYLALFFGACLGLAGCVVETTGSGGNGGGGSGAQGGGGSGAEGGGGSGVGGSTTTDTATGGGGAGGGPTCVGCGEYVTTEDETAVLCDGESTDLYNALAICTCGTDENGTDAKCFEACGANICSGGSPDAACIGCIQDTNAGCGTEFNECSNDI